MKHIALFLSIFFAAVTLTLSSCAPTQTPEATALVSELSCVDFEARLFDRLVDGEMSPGELSRLRQDVVEGLERRGGGGEFLKHLDRYLVFVAETLPERAQGASTVDMKTLYAAMELGVGTQEVEDLWAQEYQELKENLQQSLQETGLRCQAPERVEAQAVTSFAGENLVPAAARWTFATAYQSCDALKKAPLTSATPNLSGIKTWCCHPDGIGQRRTVADVSAVLRTHPYINSQAPQPGCLDLRQKPLIYDYGGKPASRAGLIDIHQNAGDGTAALGIDCSGYVSASLLTAGLKFKANVPARPAQSGVYSSRDFLNPEGRGMNCLGRIPLNPAESLRSGDIVSVPGHVLFVDDVGADPWGLAQARTEADCAKISSSGFRFTVMQSSSTLDIGLNRFRIVDYLKTGEKMRLGLEKYARQACLAKVRGTTLKPNWSEISITRHSQTTSCRSARVPLAGESCIRSCGFQAP